MKIKPPFVQKIFASYDGVEAYFVFNSTDECRAFRSLLRCNTLIHSGLFKNGTICKYEINLCERGTDWPKAMVFVEFLEYEHKANFIRRLLDLPKRRFTFI